VLPIGCQSFARRDWSPNFLNLWGELVRGITGLWAERWGVNVYRNDLNARKNPGHSLGLAVANVLYKPFVGSGLRNWEGGVAVDGGIQRWGRFKYKARPVFRTVESDGYPESSRNTNRTSYERSNLNPATLGIVIGGAISVFLGAALLAVSISVFAAHRISPSSVARLVGSEMLALFLVGLGFFLWLRV